MKLPRRKVVEVKVFGGEVTIRVSRPTWNEVEAFTADAAQNDEAAMRKALCQRVRGIEGLEVEEVGLITTMEQVFEHLPVEMAREIVGAIGDSSKPTPVEAGESEPQSSGAAST